MRNCIICDICEKKMSREEYRIQKKRSFKVIKQEIDWELDVMSDTVDLCPECWKSLADLIKNRVNLKKT